MLKFGDDAVDVIYEHLGPHDLAMCGRVCREMRPHMYRLSERCVRRLRKLHMDNPHVRVPTPGEILYQEQQEPANNKNKKVDAGGGGGGEKEKEETVTIVAGNYLRQFRDMLKQRVMVMGGHGGSNRVDMLDVVVVSSKSKTGGGGGEEKETEHRWVRCPPLLHDRNYLASAWLKGEVFCISKGTVERCDTLSKRRTLLRQHLPLKDMDCVSLLDY